MTSGLLRQRIIKSKELKGYLVATVVNDVVYFGHSLCDNEDVMDKHNAFVIAFNRAEKNALKGNNKYEVPSSITNEYCLFVERAYRYFKGYTTNPVVIFTDGTIKSVFTMAGEQWCAESILALANELREKRTAKKKEELELDQINISNVSYWLKKATAKNSNKNLIALYHAIGSYLHDKE